MSSGILAKINKCNTECSPIAWVGLCFCLLVVRRDFICVDILLRYLFSAGSVLFIHKMRSEPEQSGWYFNFAPYNLFESVEMKKLSSSGDAKILFDVFMC